METNKFTGNDKVLWGFIFAVLTFWLFANSMLNIQTDIVRDLGVEQNSMNVVVSLAALFSGLFIVVLGGLGDSIGRKKVFNIGLYLAIAGSLLIAFAPKGDLASAFLIVGRALQGFSAACLAPTSLGMVKVLWAPEKRQRAVSYWCIGTFGGSGLSSLTGGIIASSLGWRYVFVLSALFAVVALVLTKELPENKRESIEKYRPDWAGIFIFMIALLALNLFVSKGNQFGWLSLATISLLTIAIVFTYIFIRIENRAKSPFVDFSLFKNKVFTGATIANFFLNGTIGLLIVSLSLMQKAAGYNAMQAGMLTIGYAVAVILFTRVGEKLLGKFGARKPIIWGTSIVGIALILTMQTHLMTQAYVILAVAAYTLFGLGLAFFATPVTDAALSNLPDNQAGAGAGIFKMASALGASFGMAISAGVYTAVLSRSEPIEWLSNLVTYVGRQDNVIFRQGAMLGIAVCLLFAVLTIVTTMATIPNKEEVKE